MAKEKKKHIRLYQLKVGDTLQILRRIPDDSFNLIITSPPYNIGKIYERDKKRNLDEYKNWQKEIAVELIKKLKKSGSLCWQVGNYVKDGEVFPLDFIFYDIFTSLGLKLRNRIIWKFNFGLNADLRFSGRYETLLWFTKEENYQFNLDAVRIPQLYPGKRHAINKPGKGGTPSGNPLGKNPADFWEFNAENDFKENPIWDIPNVKARHPEKTIHPCQFPIELAERCVLAFTKKGDAVLDPFVGTGASVIAAVKNNRHGFGIDKEKDFLDLARSRLKQLQKGKLLFRPIGKPIRRPNTKEKVAQIPEEWRQLPMPSKGSAKRKLKKAS